MTALLTAAMGLLLAAPPAKSPATLEDGPPLAGIGAGVALGAAGGILLYLGDDAGVALWPTPTGAVARLTW